MHSTNTTQTWTHSTHTEYTHSTPTLTPTTTAFLVIIHTDNRKRVSHTTQRHTDTCVTGRVRAKRANAKAAEFS